MSSFIRCIRPAVATAILASGLARCAFPQTARTVNADLAVVTQPHTDVPMKVVGAGRAEEALRADWQAQLATVQSEIGFKYLRMHGILNDEMGVYTEDAKGNPQVNFQYIDAVYDALLKMHIRPFVELAFMPSKLASGTSTIFWWKGNTSPPKDPVKWAFLIRSLLDHFKQRYGEQEMLQWYYEVWNEPDIRGFWPYSLDEYFKLYKVTAEAVKQACPKCRVGGPASAIPYKAEEEFEKWVVANHEPVDFISSHAYGVKQGFLDENGQAGTIIDPDPDGVSGRMRHSRELLNASPLSKLELHFTEWSSAYTPTDFMHDQYHQASFILDKVKRASPYVDSMSYWTFTDIFEENGPRFTPFHGGFGMINLEGIKKPSFYAFKFLSKLGTEDVKSDDAQSWVTKSPDGSVQALIWDYSPVVPPNNETDQTFYQRDLPPADKGTVELKLAHVPDGKYRMRVVQVGYEKNDAFTAYVKMGSPRQLTRAQVEALNEVSGGSPMLDTLIAVKGGSFRRTMPLRANDIFFLTLTPVSKGQ